METARCCRNWIGSGDCVVTGRGDGECIRIPFQFDLEDTDSFVSYSMNPIRS